MYFLLKALTLPYENLMNQGTYSNCSKELIVVNHSISVSIEMVKNLLGFLFANWDTIVLQTPSEIINIKGLVSIVIHGSKDPCNASDTVWTSLNDLRLDLTNQVINCELVQFVNCHCVLRGWSCDEVEYVLILLELCWNITRNNSFVL